MDKDSNGREFHFAKLSDLKVPVTFRISQLEGTRKPLSFTELLDKPELKHSGLQLPTLSDLYVTCQLVADNKPLTIPFRTSFKAFNTSYIWNEWITLPINYCDLPLGAQITFTVWDIAGPRTPMPVGGSTFRLFGKKMTLRRGKHRLLLWKGQEADGSINSQTPSKVGLRDEMGRLEKLMKKFDRGDLPRNDWLDLLAFRRIEEIHKTEEAKSENLYLYIDLPKFDFPIVYNELESYPVTNRIVPQPQAAPAAVQPVININQDPHLWAILDPDMELENPVEDKHRRLVRSHRNGPLDRELKPNPELRNHLDRILNYAPTQVLNAEEKDMIWKFRYYLTRDKRGLTKFIKSVTWRDANEVKQAVEILLPLWTDIDTDDALELLGPNTVDSRVRRYAVKQLNRAGHDELMLYLLQLVQALKFESMTSSDQRSSRSANSAIAQEDSGLADFLIDRAVKNPVFGNRFYWYLMVEIGVEDKVTTKFYGKVVFRFQNRIAEADIDSEGVDRRETLRKQAEFIQILSSKAKELRTSKDARPKKIDKLRAFVGDAKNGLANLYPVPLPLDASKEIVGIIPEQSSVFKSNLFPLLLHFQCSDGTTYPVIFKNGDDMRQDQLVIQLFRLMDRLLRMENLDLKLSPYEVLATGPLEGMAQFIPSKTIQAIVDEYGTLVEYLKAHHPDEGSVGTFGVQPSVLDTYIRSCAGYCVVTYLMGVGDRHLDNLLLAPDGHFFHVDFGYILGRDPKPFPPPVKLCKEMVQAMGGAQSAHYQRFNRLCYTAFTILRKHSNLIINLVSLMVDANIPDIKHRDVHEHFLDKFRLDLTEEEAIKHFESLLPTSYFTAMLDMVHHWAQYWRS
ncbi:Phosphatidylinositol 3-kinase vps34 Short=PI3-kinase vps34; Short=PI3K vps34; Short=PtdIns-3-kinase vps34; AltName: Full=Vacuolar protein sorting-associated protein 34 [Serendipita indica DSM 11827]|uniref:Phosphatidylinositol 3-kinase VPS34 n=1 Tax=Serendipita indica (strain DSM 11827) TaxID=1109443 RepID=G4TVH1_SERID|nr:Phosphatidylinositol 3-kinase vps34 Short=PI3-kinase vps34; Short=PI3K vps34; Short=PtdIns-3-kinase vps34; AltName: Full=Vacuolar protein sorting-associated protein 34 [Serendipita indica DSM 11827]CCA75314.1 related to phosphatidylinositol 3-kinase [Serendipita indica DSM 11827]